MGGKTTASIKVKPGAALDILVENMGRINHGPLLQDPKGIIGDVMLNNVALRNWMIFPLDLDPVVKDSVPAGVGDEDNSYIPTFYTGEIPPAPDGIPKDTFLYLPRWFKVRKSFAYDILKLLRVGLYHNSIHHLISLLDECLFRKYGQFLGHPDT